MACSENHCGNTVFDGQSAAYRRALWIVIVINATMAMVEMTGGLIGQSVALQADALDFIGDAATYGLSLAVIGRSLKVRSMAAIIKGLSLLLLGLWVLGSTIYRVFVLQLPDPIVMGAIGVLALAANMVSVLILLRFRDGDANVRSVWLCSRNDAIGNFAVVLAATGVFATQTGWPDVVIAGGMAALFLCSATGILRQARREWQAEAA